MKLNDDGAGKRPSVPSSPHQISITLGDGLIVGTFTCEALPGATCRQHCPSGCECWPCEHDLVDSGECVVLPWMDNDDWSESYIGEPTEPVSGWVEFEWNGDGYDWRYAEAAQDALPLDMPTSARAGQEADQ